MSRMDIKKIMHHTVPTLLFYLYPCTSIFSIKALSGAKVCAMKLLDPYTTEC